ncbi:FAS-associated factor 2 [Trichoplax sp. H2]|nr:FAS-associated factor 2 [Trichoplax sp. H2]|eukprot:RDD42132.1 FAS-associated factor 2 [Trichoplax sp. H2]
MDELRHRINQSDARHEHSLSSNNNVDQQSETTENSNINENVDGQTDLIRRPIQFLTAILRNVLTFTSNFINPMTTAIQFLVHLLIGRRTTGDRRQVVNSIAFLEAFQRDFGERCPTFYRGSYKQAVNSAKEGLQFLLVYIHSRMHQDTDTFCREVLCNEQFVEFINNNQVLTWGGDVDTYEGYREACEALRPATFPFLAVISQRDNKMVVVKRIEGLLELDEVVAMLKQTFEDNEPYLVVARDERYPTITLF